MIQKAQVNTLSPQMHRPRINKMKNRKKIKMKNRIREKKRQNTNT